MKFLTFSALALLTCGCAAQAADIIPVTPAFNWSGSYVGAELGYGWGQAASPWGSPSTAATFPFTQNPAVQNGVFGGLDIGYNYQINQLVLGVEADAFFDGIRGDDGGSGGNVNGVEHKFNGSARARVGFAADRALIYGTGGVAFLSADATNTSITPNERIATNWTGWTLGAGVEYAITNNWTTRVEYRHTDYGSAVARFPVSGYAENINPVIDSVMVGINYKF